MSDQKDMLADSVSRLFRDAGDVAAEAEKSGFPAALWQQVEDLGLPLVLVPEAAGGVDGDWEDVYEVLHAAGRHAIPLPIGEAILAARLQSDSGLDPRPGLTTIAAVAEQGKIVERDGRLLFSGRLPRVPWGRHARTVLTVVGRGDGRRDVLQLPVMSAQVAPGENCAGEPRDSLVFDNVPASVAASESAEAARLFDHAALLRAAQCVGALEAALRRSIDYAQERKQFGRSISQFQVVQQQLALFGAEVAAVSCATRSACRAASVGADTRFAISAAKLRANLAIGLATATAHQVHAAIGFTREYGLRHLTQRLWAWRSEFGNDRYWSERLGAAIAAEGAGRFWADLTARDDTVALAS